MSRSNAQSTHYVSLAVMLLMLAALVAGQADAGKESASWDEAGIELAAETGHFRSEDE